MLLLGAIVLVISDDSDGEGGGDELATGQSTATIKAEDDPTATSSPSSTTSPPSTVPSTTTSTEPAQVPAEASLGDCVQLTEDATARAGTEPCASGLAPYRVTQVVDDIGDCPEPLSGGGRVESGDFALCLETELEGDHCYVIPEHAAAITPAECGTPGSARVTIIWHDEDETGENTSWSCDTDYFFVFEAPQMVVCVRRY